MDKPTVAVGFIGTQLDFAGKRVERWNRWRPTISLVSQPDLLIDELHLLHDNHSLRLAGNIVADIKSVSPETTVHLHNVNMHDPWDFEEAYGKTYDWLKQQNFSEEDADLLFHITTGTHVTQICTFLLTESRHFPGRLIQTSPSPKESNRSVGKFHIIDLDLSRYDQLANRFNAEQHEATTFLKNGIQTKNPAFNQLIDHIEKVALKTVEPMLITGPTGAGKSQLASRIYQLKQKRGLVSGEFVAVNCATLKGENAMAALFGHTKGAFTGAQKARDGFLLTADNGVLFLDEIGELGLEEQAMLLHAIENKRFHPVGSDTPVSSDFQLIAGTNQDLWLHIAQGRFREDLLARINLWSWQLPGLKDRKEDIPANIEFELDKYTEKTGYRIQFNKEAREDYLAFAQAPQALWRGNFRDLGASVTRLCTLAETSRITRADVADELPRLQQAWGGNTLSEQKHSEQTALTNWLTEQQLATIDEFDQHQLQHVINVCRQHPSMAAAGRRLFNVSRLSKASNNDSARLQKYLAKFGLTWKAICNQH